LAEPTGASAIVFPSAALVQGSGHDRVAREVELQRVRVAAVREHETLRVDEDRAGALRAVIVCTLEDGAENAGGDVPVEAVRPDTTILPALSLIGYVKPIAWLALPPP